MNLKKKLDMHVPSNYTKRSKADKEKQTERFCSDCLITESKCTASHPFCVVHLRMLAVEAHRPQAPVTGTGHPENTQAHAGGYL